MLNFRIDRAVELKDCGFFRKVRVFCLVLSFLIMFSTINFNRSTCKKASKMMIIFNMVLHTFLTKFLTKMLRKGNVLFITKSLKRFAASK